MKVRVHGKVLVSVSIDVDVETDDKQAAYEAAEEKWPGLSDYCGNGRRSGGLMGPADPLTDNASVEAPDDAPEWDSVELR